jgi:hypothetical protein
VNKGTGHECVLGPLVRAHRLEQRAPLSPTPGCKDLTDGRHLRGAADERTVADHVCLGGGAPDGQIVGMVADVVEAAFAEPRHQQVALRLAPQVDPGRCPPRFVEDAEVIRDQRHQALIGRRGEHQPPAGGVLRLQPGQHLGVVGQHARVDLGARGELALEPVLATREPAGHLERRQRLADQVRRRRLDQKVRRNERAVEVDREGRELRRVHVRKP